MIILLLLQYLYKGDYHIPYSMDEAVNQGVATYHGRTPRDKHDLQYTYKFPHTCDEEYCEENVCPHLPHNSEAPVALSHLEVQNYHCEVCTIVDFVGTEEALLVHAKVYTVADKYDVPGLKSHVAAKFHDTCRLFWNSTTFPLAARFIFESTPEHDEQLRDIVFETIESHRRLIKKPAVKAFLMAGNGVAFRLLKFTWEQHNLIY